MNQCKIITGSTYQIHFNELLMTDVVTNRCMIDVSINNIVFNLIHYDDRSMNDHQSKTTDDRYCNES
jgi:hypothetical protein